MNWKDGIIDDVLIAPFQTFSDERGWLTELFRRDGLLDEDYPEMGYLSVTHADVARGPHEHESQTDRFAFFQGTYTLYLWDARTHSSTYGIRQVIRVGENNPATVVIPPGIVHAYKNTGESDAFVLNFPNKLYAGVNKSEPVDEIRHEDDPTSPYQLD